MKYVMKSKDGIFYEKRRVGESVALDAGDVEVEKSVYEAAPLPCRCVDGEFVAVAEHPVLEYKSTEVLAAVLRERAYNTEAIIPWDGEMLTVTQAAQLWQYYAAEGSDKAAELQTMIAAAKQTIRGSYPDEEV